MIYFLYQAEGFSSWLFKQSVQVVLLVLAVIAVARYFTKQTEKQAGELKEERSKHEENLKSQIDKAEKRADKYDVAMERRDQIARENAKAQEMVADRLRDLGEEIRSRRK